LVLEEAEIIEKTIDIHFLISFDYKNMNKVMRVIKEKKLDIVTQTMELEEDSEQTLGKIEVKTRKKNAEMIFDIFDKLFEIDIKRL
jgi:putative IMPACT (imprinted ancient) family translation regulator